MKRKNEIARLSGANYDLYEGNIAHIEYNQDEKEVWKRVSAKLASNYEKNAEPSINERFRFM